MWYDEPKKLVDFAKVLVNAGIVDSMDAVVDKPYKYSDHYDIWDSMSFPTEEDSEWDEFVKALEPEEDD
jgi:hypothetical protein